MKALILGLFCFFLVFNGQGQTEVRLKTYFKGVGIIFAENERINISLELGDFFKPSLEDVEKAEQILHEDLKGYLNEKFIGLNEEYSLSKKDLMHWKRTINNADSKKIYWHYNRQYAGYINSRGKKLIYVRLLNFKDLKESEKYFENWKEEIVIGFGEFFEKNSSVFIVNIEEEEILR